MPVPDTEQQLDALVAALRELILAGEYYRCTAGGALGVTVTEGQAISYLLARGPLGPSELASALHLTTGSTTALIDRLERKHLVNRQPHPADRRRSTITFAAPADPQLAHLQRWLTDICNTVPPGQRESATRLLNALAAGLREYDAALPDGARATGAPITPDSPTAQGSLSR